MRRAAVALFILCLLSLTACGALGSADLGAVVIAAGPLPPSLRLGTLSDSVPRQLYPGVPPAQSVSLWKIEPSGTITLFTYADTTARDVGFAAVADTALATPTDLGIGERAALASPEDGCAECTEVVFARCLYVGHVRMFHVRPDQVMAYTRALDGAVTERLCPSQ
jgi:hypothetical protein